MSRLLRFGLACFFILSAACSGRVDRSIPGPGEGAVYRPPTAVASSTPRPPASSDAPARAVATAASVATTASVAIEPQSTATPSCTDNLTYLEDLTIPDGMSVTPGQSLEKRWRVENSGTCNWDDRYRLRLNAGPALGAPAEQSLYPARSGTELEVRMLFSAPNEPGTHRSAWQAYDPQGRSFGDPIFVEIVVEQAPPEG